MNQHSLLTTGCLAVLVMFGSVIPVFAQPAPQLYGPQAEVVIDWEDEFIQDVSTTRMATEQKSLAMSKKPMFKVSTNTPVIDWEDEFSYEMSMDATTQNDQAMVKRENAASWDHEAWQSM